MPVDRQLWKRSIRKTFIPSGWHCPTCAAGYLQMSPEAFRSSETAESRRVTLEAGIGREDIKLRFATLLGCNNSRCRETVSVVGRGGYEQVFDDDKGVWSWEHGFLPLFIDPPVYFISLPKGMPNLVREQLLQSFAVLWSSPSSAANLVRIAIEELLTALRIPKARRIKGVRMARISLHNRIELLRSSAPEAADALLAIKWVGNAGSHLGSLTRDDVFDAYDILESVLDDLYVKNREAMQKLIRDIIRRKGPKRKRGTRA